MSEHKKYYQHITELKSDKLVKKPETDKDREHKQDLLSLLDGSLNGTASRRNFLKLAGYSAVLGTVLSSCEKPVQKAIPYLIKPEEITPGKADFYASTFFDGEEYCSILVKSRDGRPIKVEGNSLSSLTRGGTSARVQASVLSLYDDNRHKSPVHEGKEISWEAADREIIEKLNAISSKSGSIVLLTPTLISPSAASIIREFLAHYPSAEHVVYDTVSCTGMLLANELNFGLKVLPTYYFDHASLIVSFDADFLGTWISPVEFTAQYATGRKLKDNRDAMSRHVQFETGMSLTGSNADVRYPIKPSQTAVLLSQLIQALDGNASGLPDYLAKLAVELLELKGKSLVVAGSNDVHIQLMVNKINYMLGNYGNTIDLTRPVFLRKGIDKDMIDLVSRMGRGNVDALIVYNTNPVYHYPEADKFKEGLKKTGLTVSLSVAKDETSLLCNYILPAGHFLESWGDSEPASGFYSLQQPLIHPVFNTRQWEETLLKWTASDLSMHDYMKDYWEKNLFIRHKEKDRFYDFWVTTLQKGIFEPEMPPKAQPAMRNANAGTTLSEIPGIEIHLYQPVALATGRHANNPWLQEMPDPVSKTVWDNYAAISPKFASDNGLEDFDVIEIDEALKIPVLIQPGQAYGTISIALGYGRMNTGKVADNIGINAFPLAKTENEVLHFSGRQVSFRKALQKYTIARSQVRSSLDGRPIFRETILDRYHEKPDSGNEMHAEIEKKSISLYKKPVFDGFHWGLSVDLNSCTGCGACLIACQAENNVPVVGRTEVTKYRIMHWIRIDRYYAGDPEKPDVVHQPVMCMHCDNAPCENVCPVSATPHNNEGLNQVAYTRCIGTKYCINNCPYKVRKFNWFQYAKNPKFDYHVNSDLGRLVLNPDVTVRERGVVEKCSFCSQRIQEKKLQAKLENRVLNGEEVQPACVQACPAQALVFGDLNNKENEVSKLTGNERNYYLLEELHTLPSVGYLTKVRNRSEQEEPDKIG
jgi:molybdopterin-containing oxidoreductase family iron-sulfur binding subunit